MLDNIDDLYKDVGFILPRFSAQPILLEKFEAKKEWLETSLVNFDAESIFYRLIAEKISIVNGQIEYIKQNIEEDLGDIGAFLDALSHETVANLAVLFSDVFTQELGLKLSASEDVANTAPAYFINSVILAMMLNLVLLGA